MDGKLEFSLGTLSLSLCDTQIEMSSTAARYLSGNISESSE